MNHPSFRPPNLTLATIGLCLATFMQVLDTTIANVSLPTIAGNLGVSSDQSAWVITSFAVSNAIALPLTGFLVRRYGETRLFVLATLLFSLASLLCGVAQSMGVLVGFRALQGAVAGPMYPITQSLLISIYPANKRGQALALLAMITVVAPIAGPILGGWITDNYSWPWIFFINVPIGIFASWVVANQMKGRPEKLEKPKMDYVGLITLVIGVGALQVLLDKGNDLDWFESSFIVVLGIIAAVSLTVFLIWEMTDKDPIVNLRLFRHRNFAAGTVTLTLGYAGFFGMSLLLPLWLQTQLHYTSVWAGLATAPIGVLPVVLTPFVGKYAPRFDLRVLASFSFIVLAATSFMRAAFTIDVDFASVALVQLLMGLGVAFYFMPVLSIVLSDLHPHEISAGSGLATFLRTLGGSFAASLTTWIWQHRAIEHHARLTEHISVYDPATQHAITQFGQGSLARAATVMDQLVQGQALMMSTIDYFNMLGWLFLGLIAVVFFAKPPFAPKGGGASAAAAGGH
ncbi:DHA2 family multidrug resistance protein [Silvimonas terrae]|uniref:DHA2 family multidrug resistance protein n=1 Tax=Silvimonas terrae TaxID=300266 RepID=A0A840RAI8_9NEIS|nr:DHA2 family efflux MFS transporter permease subunit [Silvimonas terrae]MBB5189548.1 DHA2 family multidrug resistance protein [Silvimonas terrae]